MIKELVIGDLQNFLKLGKMVNNNFGNLYDLDNLLNSKADKVIGYYENGLLVGFIHISISFDVVDIVNIVVDDKYRRKGIGTKLLNYIILSKDIAEIWLEVRKSNKSAISFYEKNGFSLVRVRSNYYGDEDALIMKRDVNMKDVYILAIESSCDETSIAIIKNGHECVQLTVLTQMDTHAEYGGVVPEIASRMHTENITMVLEETLTKAKMKVEDMDAIAVTYSPGLLGSLLVGVEFAKTLSFVYNKPLIAVNHIAGHIYANNLEGNLQFPLLALVVSGGHTDLIIMKDDYVFEKVGGTLDDAIGECYDKVARVLGLKYPGGPNVEKEALNGKYTYDLPIPMNDDSLNISYSGLKSSIINLVHNEKQRGNEIRKEDLAKSFQEVAIDQLVRKSEIAIKKYKVKNMIVAGGVSANKMLREKIKELTDKYDINLSIPSMLFCTDNAAMIGAAAYPLYLRKEFANLDLNASSNQEIY